MGKASSIDRTLYFNGTVPEAQFNPPLTEYKPRLVRAGGGGGGSSIIGMGGWHKRSDRGEINIRYNAGYDRLIFTCANKNCDYTLIQDTNKMYSFKNSTHFRNGDPVLGACSESVLELTNVVNPETNEATLATNIILKHYKATEGALKVFRDKSVVNQPPKKVHRKMSTATAVAVAPSKAVLNPNRNRLSKVAETYAENPESYRANTVGLGVAGATTGVVSNLAWQGVWILPQLLGLVLLPLAILMLGLAAKRVYFWRVGDRISIDKSDFYTPYLRNTFDDLLSVKNQYHMNVAAVPPHLRANVELDEASLNQRLWEISSHLMDMQRFYQSKGEGEFALSLTNRTSDIIGETIADIKQEITKLQEAVQNCSDIAVLSVSDNIRKDYLDPTIADTLRSISSQRLGGRLELTVGGNGIAMEAAEEVAGKKSKV